jgi:hypothetical protein
VALKLEGERVALKTYSGSCHCGAVRYEADLDLSQGTTRCDCSLCSKARAWFAFAKAAQVRVLAGADALADYQWIPPGKPHPFLHYRFCKTCGVRTFAQGGEGSSLGDAFYAVAIASLDGDGDGVDADELAASIKYVDGRHDHYDRPPQDVRLM